MPRLKPFDKRTATTYALVNRPQHDPRIHDEDASSHVFTEISTSRNVSKKIKQRGDLEEEFGVSLQDASAKIRDNEGEAAQHGVFFDDSSYDYMQHLRDVGTGGADTVFVEAKGKQKPKPRRLEDSLKSMQLDEDERLDEDYLGGQEDELRSLGAASFASSRMTSGRRPVEMYQQQQDVPDEIAGFQPDMDPRLREVLEALEDDAYVDYEENDIFEGLVADGAQELDLDEWADDPLDDGEYDDEEGWESDDTTKPAHEYSLKADDTAAGDLMKSLAKAKALSETQSMPRGKALAAPSTAGVSTSTVGRRKQRKGALTSVSGFSMTSSSIARTETLSVLDSRFEKLAEQYMDDLPEEDEDDTASQMSGLTSASRMTGMSQASRMSKASRVSSRWGGSEAPSLVSGNLESAGFNNIMDSFLGTAGQHKAKKMKKGGSAGFWGQQSGMEQLDEIRQGLRSTPAS